MNCRLVELPYTMIVIVAALHVVASATQAMASDEPPPAEETAAPAQRPSAAERARERRALREQEASSRPARTDAATVLRGRVDLTDQLLNDVLHQVGVKNRSDRPITQRSLLEASLPGLRSRLSRQPPEVVGHVRGRFADLMERAGMYDEAAAELRLALEAWDSVGNNLQVTTTERRLAQALRDSGQWEEALPLFEKHLSTNPRPLEVMAIVNCLENLERYEEAAQLFPTAITAGTGHVWRARYGRMLLETARLDEAEQAFRGAFEAAKRSHHVESPHTLGMKAALELTLSLQGQDDEREFHHVNILRSARFFQTIGQHSNWYWIGRYLAHTGEYELAHWFLDRGLAAEAELGQTEAERRSGAELLASVRSALGEEETTASLRLP